MNKRLQAFLANPGVSYWLKDAIRSSLDRDIVDAVNDAQDLLDILTEHLEQDQWYDESLNPFWRAVAYKEPLNPNDL